MPARCCTLHASCVAVDGQAALIIGASGCGKSGLALQLMAMGAGLVADDQTVLTAQDDAVIATCPPQIAGMIEARGMGILNAAVVPGAPVRLIVDLDRAETERLPPKRHYSLLGRSIDLVFNAPHSHFSQGILQYLRAGRAR